MKTALITISILAASSLMLQGAEPVMWTLDQCVDYAVEHNLTVQMRENSVASAELSVTEAKSRFLPNVSANAGQSWNIGRGLTSQNLYANRNTSSFNWGASLSLPVFSGLSRVRQLDYAKANLKTIVENCEAAKEDITINVISSYLQILYNREMTEVAQHQVDLSTYELARRQALLEAGKIPEADMLEAKAQLASDMMNLTQANNDYLLARLDLAQLLQLEAEAEQFDVAPLAGHPMLAISAEEAYKDALQHNHAIAAARRGIEASDASIKLARTGYIPTLSFNAGLGSSYYKVSGYDNEPFGDQMRHNYSTYFGLSLNIPIFDGFTTRNSVKRAKLDKMNAELQLDQTEQQLYRAIQQAYYQARAAEEKLKASTVAEDAALKSFESIQEKYGLGRANPTDYEQAKNKALRATADRIQANYELILRSRLLAFYATPH